MDEELLQDFLVEAGEILEQLNEQLVDLENSPDDMDMLNTVFRGFHTIKGGAGFLEIPQMVEICHSAEDVFNLLRNGERSVDATLMDTMLPVLDVLNEQFECLRNGDEPPHAEPALLSGLTRIIKGEVVVAAPVAESSLTVQVEPAQAAPPQPVEDILSGDTIVGGGENISDEEFDLLLKALQNPDADIPVNAASSASATDPEDITDEQFDQILDKIHGKGKFIGKPQQAASAQVSSTASSDEISEDEFDQLLDDIHGKGNLIGKPSSDIPAPVSSTASSDEISEGEFDQLLDDIHGKGQFNPAASKTATPVASQPTTKAVATDEISDKEFDQLLDDIHGKGQFTAKPAVTGVADDVAPTEQTPVSSPEAMQTIAAEVKSGDIPVVRPAKSTAASKDKSASQAETTVRVDTKRLDDIMNMVGELVLVRNRIGRLGANLGDEEMVKAVANLDLVTTDLQMSVMKTRMQPIKKVFGRFPRVVRDIARNLKKEIKLEIDRKSVV